MKQTFSKILKDIFVKRSYLIIPVFQFLLSFCTDRYIFATLTKETIIYYVFDKIVYLLVLVLIWHYLFLAIRGRKENGFKYRMLKYSILFGCIYALCVLCIYPMIEFGGDMPFFESAAREYRLDGGLHWITTLVWILGYMMFPCEGGPTIIMTLLSITAHGYICAKMDDMNINRIFRILFLLPPIIMYSLYPTRMTTMTIVYMVYFTILYTDYSKGEELNNKKLWILLLFTGMLSAWRMEGVYLLVFAPLFLILAYRQRFKLKLYLKYFVCIFIMNIILSIPSPEVSLADKVHPIVGYMIPLMEMSGVDLEECEEYSILNQYVDMELVKEKEEGMGLELYRADYLEALEAFREDPSVTKEEYVWAAVKMCLKNPFKYLETRLKVFAITNASSFPFTGSKYLNEEGKIESKREIMLYILNDYKSAFLDIKMDNGWTVLWRTVVNWTKNFTWQLWTTLIMMIWLIRDTVKRKDWFVFWYTMGMWIYAAIVFLFSPGAIFKYYLPQYTYAILIVIFYLSRKKLEESKEYECKR